MVDKTLANIKGPRGNGVQTPRITLGALWLDEIKNGMLLPRNVGMVQGPQGLPGTNAVENDTAFATCVAATTSLTRSALNNQYDQQSTVDVDALRLPTDLSASESWQRAINKAKSFGIRRVLGKSNSYLFHVPVDYSGLTDCTISGNGRDATTIKGMEAIDSAFANSTGNARGITFYGITFLGNAVDDTTAPQRGRTTSGVSFNIAIRATGAWAEDTMGPLPTGKSCTDIQIDSCAFKNLATGLPMYFQGVKGYAKVTSSLVENCLDSGFIYCADVQFTNNLVRRSRDNGVSVSRGCQSVTVVGNRIEDSCYWGIWTAGFEGGRGPERILVAANNISGTGYGASSLDDGPRNVTVIGNTADRFYRGPVDEPNSIHGRGVSVTGWPSGNLASPTHLARNVTISGNTFIDPPRGGVSFRGVDGIAVIGNTIINPGSATNLTGTAISATDQSQNYGISMTSGYAGTVSNATVAHNIVVDYRPTPVMNWAVNLAGVSNGTMLHNTAVGNRQQLQETPENGNTKIYNRNVDIASRVTVGGTAAALLRMTGPTATYRTIVFQTDGVDRWAFRMSNTAEGSGNTGGDLEFVRYDNSGTFISGGGIVIRRSNGQLRATYPIKGATSTTAARPTPASVEAGAFLFDTNLNRPIWSDGTRWLDAVGNVVG